MGNKFSMDDYIDVAERIVEFDRKYPEGSLQTINWQVTEVGGRTFVVYHAAAYRTPDDSRPGQGIAWEPFPGPTPYTKDSELMNAETAAWGRAIVACGLPASRKIASKQEVQARQGAQPPASNGNAVKATADDVKALLAAAKGLTVKQVKLGFSACGLTPPEPFEGDVFADVPQAKAGALAQALAKAERAT